MKKLWLTAPLILCVVLACSALGAEIKPTELLENGGFEKTKNGAPVGWEVNNAGNLTSTTDARSGRHAARFEMRPHEWGYCAFARGIENVNPKATYRLSLWAKGKGNVSVDCYQSSKGGFLNTQFLKPSLRLSDEWQKIEYTYTPGDERISKVAFAVHLSGPKDAVAYVDDASFTFNPEDNPDIELAPEEAATKDLKIRLRQRDASANLYVNGERQGRIDGVATVSIPEGLVSLCVEAEATGDDPGISVKLVNQPETDGRWRLATEKEDGWKAPEFNDAGWQVTQSDGEGYIWAEQPDAPRVLLRQVVLWNETHYGTNRCIVPPVEVWGFPREGFEILQLALYSPLPYRLGGYEFTLDVPEQIRLLDKTDYWQRYIDNVKPEAVSPV